MATISRGAMSTQIVGGPSKWDLMPGLFDSNVQGPRPVVVKYRSGPGGVEEVKISVSMVRRDSDNSWTFEGQTMEGLRDGGIVARDFADVKARVGAHYDSHLRFGFIVFYFE